MNKKIFLILSIFCILGCSKVTSSPNVDNVKTYLEDTVYHEKQDIDEVVDMLIEEFKTSDTFVDCTLDEINYYENRFERENDEDVYEMIILEMVFTTGDKPHMAFNQNETLYYDVRFVKETKESSWTLKGMGI